MQHEEAIVRRETARRLVPPARARPSWCRRLDGLEPITAALVAEEFDVPSEVAAEALTALRQQRPPASQVISPRLTITWSMRP